MKLKKTEQQLDTPLTSVLWVAQSNFANGNGIKVHEHGYYHLFMIRQGNVVVSVDRERYSLTDGEAILSGPGVPHGMSEVTIPMVNCYEIKFVVGATRLRKILSTLPDKLPADPFVISLVKEIVTEGACGEPMSATLTSDYLLTLINYLHRHYGSREQTETTVIDTTGYSELSRRIVNYLESNFNREVPLQELADEVGFNKNYICSAFKRDTNMTIGTCMTTIRIHKAAELISFSDMNLNQVAEATGFVNQSHFNRIFKKIVGLPPGQYRRMFTADILISPDIAEINDDLIQGILDQNGFIASVMGHKLLSIEDILRDIGETVNTEREI